jgi:hypothetical protein
MDTLPDSTEYLTSFSVTSEVGGPPVLIGTSEDRFNDVPYRRPTASTVGQSSRLVDVIGTAFKSPADAIKFKKFLGPATANRYMPLGVIAGGIPFRLGD